MGFTEVAQSRSSLNEPRLSGLISRWAWVPIPLYLAAIFILWLVDGGVVSEAPYLLIALNFVFLTIVSVFVALLAARSFIWRPAVSVLLLGAGVLCMGTVSLVAGMAIRYQQINLTLTIYNTGMCLAGILHAAGAMTSRSMMDRVMTRPSLIVIATYVLMLAGIGLLTFAAATGVIPPFWIPDEGGTTLRQAVLILAVGTFALASILLMLRSSSGGSRFARWYGMGAALIAIGLFAVLLAEVRSPLIWVGRSAQYLAGIYILTAMFIAAREIGGWRTALGSALRESEQRFDALVESLPHLVWMTDEQGQVTYTCRAWTEYTGLTPTESRNDGWKQPFHPEDLPRIKSRWQEAVQDGRRYELEVRLKRSDDAAYRWHILRGSPVRDEEGPVLGWIGTCTEIDDRKQLEQAVREREEQLRQSHDELERRVAERTAQLQQRADQLAKLASELTLTEQRERRHLAQVLHDHLQQLLVAAKFGLDVLFHHLDDKRRESLRQVIALIDQSLETSRSLTVELSPPILYEAGLVPAIEWLARSMKQKYGLQVHVELDREATTDREDVRVLTYQAVRELLFNVVKHAHVREAFVEMAVHDADHLRVNVEDRGRGFDPDHVLKHRDQATSGFGLLSIRERSMLLGGRFEIDSSPDGGSRFTLIVPSRPEQKTSAQSKSHPPESLHHDEPLSQHRTTHSNGHIRLLMVDDHEVMRQGLSLLLSYDETIEVVGEASNGVEAIDLSRALQPDVVLMDFSMPVMDGVEATRRIRQEMPDIQIIGLSMYEESDRAEAMRDAGAAAYLSKSGKSEELLRTIRSVSKSAINEQ